MYNKFKLEIVGRRFSRLLLHVKLCSDNKLIFYKLFGNTMRKVWFEKSIA